MSKWDESAGSGAPGRTDDERRFLSGLVDGLADRDPEALLAVLNANPDLVAYCGESADIRARVRAALTGPATAGLASERQRLLERTRAALAERTAWVTQPATEDPSDAREGVLTSLTRRVSPEQAVALYRKITPVFVYQILKRLNESSSLRVVHQLVDHLCGEEVQSRLRAGEHVRDGILEEVRVVLGRSELRHQLSRDDMARLLAESGAISELVAMEKCILLATGRAG